MSRQIIYPETWSALDGKDDEAERLRFANELQKELQRTHPLHGESFTIVGRSWAKDEVLISLPNDRWAIVHLTYNGRQEIPYPVTTFFDSISALNDELEFSD